MHIPYEAPHPLPTILFLITTTLNTEYSDHKALLAEIAQIGDPTLPTPMADNYPTTRDYLPFTLASPSYLYQLGNDAIRIAQQDALHTIQQLLNSSQATTEQIDIAAKMVVETIDGYHQLAQKIWPMA